MRKLIGNKLNLNYGSRVKTLYKVNYGNIKTKDNLKRLKDLDLLVNGLSHL